MSIHLHPHLHAAMDVADGLVSISEHLVRAAARRVVPRPSRRNATLRPGPGTPLWNALVLALRPHLRRRGVKANLARELSVPPQRIHEYFVARTAAPDAERTLRVMYWLATRPPLRRSADAPPSATSPAAP